MQKRKRGRQPPPYDFFLCPGCADERPTIRNGVHVACKCGAPPSYRLAEVWKLPDWPRVIHGV